MHRHLSGVGVATQDPKARTAHRPARNMDHYFQPRELREIMAEMGFANDRRNGYRWTDDMRRV
jgi:glutamate synthase domain-containing protein 2